MNRPLLIAFICLACGIIIASFVKISIYPPFFIASFFIVSSIIIRNRHKKVFTILILISIIFLGAAYFYNFTIIAQNHIINQLDKKEAEIYINGSVAQDPFYYKTHWGQRRTNFVLKANYYKAKQNWAKTQGLCKVIIYNSDKDYSYGEDLILFGALKIPSPPANPGEFDYSRHLKQQGIYAILEVDSDKEIALSNSRSKLSLPDLLKAKLFTLRKNVNECIYRYLPEKEADLLSAIMLGLRSELPEKTKELFAQTGTAHILAISGLHLGIIACIAFFIFGLLRFPYNLRAILVISLIICYAILCGARPPVMRAAVMIVTFFIARILNREIDGCNILSLAGILMLLVNPMQLFSADFILSFVCVFSMLYLSPKIESLFMVKKYSERFFYLIRLASVSVGIYIGVAPVTAYFFNIISPVTVIANLFVVPLVGLLTMVGLVFILSGLFFPFLSFLFANTTWLVAFLLEWIIFYLSKIPFAYFYIPDLPIWFIVGYYALIILATNRKIFKLSKGAVCIIILFFVNFCIWMPLPPHQTLWCGGLLKKPSGLLKIAFLHIGHGDAIFIQFPEGQTMLIDAGSKTQHADKGKDVVMPYIWHEGKDTIDCMLITHGDLDHFGGASSIIEKARVRYFLYNGIEEGEEGYAQLMELVKSRGIKTFLIKGADRIEGLDSVQMLALNPQAEFINKGSLSANDSSVVLKLTYKNISFLLCADILKGGIKNIISYGRLLKSDIVKVPHHGSRLDEYIAEPFYSLVKPDIAVISASLRYRYPTPAESTIKILLEKGVKTYITHKNGAIVITTDGEKYDVSTMYAPRSTKQNYD